MNDDCKPGRDAAFNEESLRQPGVFPHPVAHLEIRETHVSRIILTGDFVYKIKKPVDLGFIDARTLRRRRELCELEVRLNRRLASDLYLDVVAVVRDENGGMRFGGAGDIVEYAVRMRQFDAAQELHNLLACRQVTLPEMLDLATTVARFHDRAAVAEADTEYGSAAQTSTIVLDNLRRLRECVQDAAPLLELGRLDDWTRDHVRRLHDLFTLRKQAGRIRECHGDLHARNIVRWRGALMPFDCLEFDPYLRWIDVMNDVAFLVMDLVGHERPDLAHVFLSRYLETGGDYAGVRLLSFYAVYRASVRAMVDALGARHLPAQHPALLQRLRERLHTALRFIERPAPALLIMHGPSGSGKSWLSERLVSALPALRVRSDVERKRLAGIAPLDAGAGELYSAEFTRRTYAHLLDCAEACLQGGVSVIVDAAFLRAAERRPFHDLASRLQVPYLIVACTAEPQALAQRIALRQARRVDPSDADLAVLATQLQVLQPLAGDEQAQVVTVRTSVADEVRTGIATIRQRTARPPRL